LPMLLDFGIPYGRYNCHSYQSKPSIRSSGQALAYARTCANVS
jgi:hypothetical protein